MNKRHSNVLGIQFCQAPEKDPPSDIFRPKESPTTCDTIWIWMWLELGNTVPIFIWVKAQKWEFYFPLLFIILVGYCHPFPYLFVPNPAQFQQNQSKSQSRAMLVSISFLWQQLSHFSCFPVWMINPANRKWLWHFDTNTWIFHCRTLQACSMEFGS